MNSQALIEHHLDPKRFAKTVLPWLIQQEAYNNLPLGLVIRLTQNAALVENALMLSLSDEHSQLVAVQTQPGQLVLAQTQGALELMPELISWLQNHRIPLQGLVAPAELAKAFMQLWNPQAKRPLKIEMSQRVYRLDAITPLAQPAGHFRQAELRDLSILLEWIEAFITEALPHERPDRQGIRAVTLRQIEAGDLGLWEVQNQPVSMAARTRSTPNGTAISLVYSPPQQRGKGYAGACTAALSQAQLNAGKQFCCLFTDLANLTSNQLYQRIGYQAVGDVLVLEAVLETDSEHA